MTKFLVPFVIVLGIILALRLSGVFHVEPDAAPGARPPSSSPVPPAAVTITCPRAKTLENLITCIEGQMPGKYSERFVVPPAPVHSDWCSVVTQMLAGETPHNITLPSSLGGIYSLAMFTDSDNGKSYFVLMETGGLDNDGLVDRGWGTFIVDPEPVRELSIQIAHPKLGIRTAEQGIGVFKGTNARSFLMAGAHRSANGVPSACQPSYLQADAAHNDNTLFQTTVEALLNFHNVTVGRLPAQGGFVAIQFHGMGSSSCPDVDVYMTYGVESPPVPGDRLLTLQANLEEHNPDWVVTVPGDILSCSLTGTMNIQGRLLNNVASTAVCMIGASSYTGRFIHIEQKLGCRDPDDWVPAINDAFPAMAPVPVGQ